MCTALTYEATDFYFGRNLDYEYSYHETVTVTPRNYVFSFRKTGKLITHYAMIGMAYVVGNYPLYYDATNEKGLSMAGLLFREEAEYKPYVENVDNITPFELIPWILGQCASVSEAGKLIDNMNLWEDAFSEDLPLSPLHWIISDKTGSIVLESVKEGLKIYKNPAGVLTNAPSFDIQMENLRKYDKCVGMTELPGDWSSMSRFVKATFVRKNAVSGISEQECVSQFFHILKAVEYPRGCVPAGEGRYKNTIYSSCCNTDKGIYYYTTYENNRICAVDTHKEDLDGCELISYELRKEQDIYYQNCAENL